MRVVFFTLLVLSGFFIPFWLLCLCAACYAFRYRAYELLFLGVIIDSSFAHTTLHAFPFATAAMGFLGTVSELVKPRLSVYNDAHDHYGVL